MIDIPDEEFHIKERKKSILSVIIFSEVTVESVGPEFSPSASQELRKLCLSQLPAPKISKETYSYSSFKE